MQESRLFHDLPREPDPSATKDLVLDNPDTHYAIFGLAEQMSELLPEVARSEQDAWTLAEASIALNGAHWRLDPDASDEGVLSKETYEARGLSTTSLCKALEFSTAGAESLNELTSRLYREQTTPDEPTPIMDWLNASQHSPDEARVLMQDLRDLILTKGGEVTEDLANLLESLFRTHKAVDRGTQLREKAQELIDQDRSKLWVVELVKLLIRHNSFKGVPQVDVGNMQAPELLLSINRAYRRRLRIFAALPPAALPDRENPQEQDIEQSTLLHSQPQPARQLSEYVDDSPEHRMVSRQDRIARLIYAHRERTPVYRDMRPWPHAPDFQKILKHRRLLEVRGNTPRVTSRRIIGLMVALSELGSKSSEPDEVTQSALQHQLTEFFTFERAVSANIEKEVAALRAVNVTTTLNGWEPVEPDVALLSHHWRSLLPTVRESWPQGNGQEVAAAITNVLRAFKVYQEELADPEERLKTIATYLGATILRPEHRPKAPTFDPVQRGNAISDVLESIATDEQLQENTRYRAEVLKHFLAAGDASAVSQAVQPAELFYIPPTKEQLVGYFCCINCFASPGGEVWAVIESLEYGRASYTLPQALIERESKDITPEALADFLSRYSKPRLVRSGGIQIVHSSGWTPRSHIQSIRERAAAADAIAP